MDRSDSQATYRAVRPEGQGATALEVLARWLQEQPGPVVVNRSEHEALAARGLAVVKLAVGGPLRGEAWLER